MIKSQTITVLLVTVEYNTKMQNKETGMSGMLLQSTEWRCMEQRHGGGGGVTC